ncbi:MAG: Rrf2 family transcriptional regulator [Proteobacteria bacterium]|nr:Rrf2 family transcriptional regulator [Pseudomonadota bacterium]
MQLTKQTDFAFRVLIYLASMPAQELVSIQAIAARFAISKSHVMKVVQKLAHAGYIEAVRGARGGLKMGKAAEQVSLKEIVVLMEATLEPINCASPACLIRDVCLLKSHLCQAQTQFLNALAGIRLADIVNPAVKCTLQPCVAEAG